MTLLRCVSDIHNEFFSIAEKMWEPPELDTDAETVLILAGDIGMCDKLRTIVPFVTKMAARFKHVIYVLGNHEYYKYTFDNGVNLLKNELGGLSNVSVLEKESVVVDDVLFIGATLWTDYNKGDPLIKMLAKQCMNDYKLIRTGNADDLYAKRITPDDLHFDHTKAREYIEATLANKREDQKVVIITHHLPSYQCVHPMFYGDDNNYSYYSDLDAIMYQYKPAVWCHGHTHCSVDRMIDETHVVCNPRGYTPRDLNPEFDPLLIIEV